MLKCGYCGKTLDEIFDVYNETRIDSKKVVVCTECQKIHNGIKEDSNSEHYAAYKEQLMHYINAGKMSDVVIEYALDLIDSRDRKENARKRELDRQHEIMKDIDERRKNFICTTSQNFEGYRIVKYIDVVSGEAVVGTGFWSELSAVFNDYTGTRSYTNENKLSRAKHYAQEVLKERALRVGANAIVAIDFDIMTLGNDMITVSANGTAVKIEKI